MGVISSGVTTFRDAVTKCNHFVVTTIPFIYGKFSQCNRCNHFIGTYPLAELCERVVPAWCTGLRNSRRGDVSFFGYSGYSGFLNFGNRIGKPNSPSATVTKEWLQRGSAAITTGFTWTPRLNLSRIR